jgi:replicative DNA helicase
MESPFFLDDRARPTLNEIKAKARRCHKEHGIKFIAVDYLQLVRHNAPETAGSREREVAEISAGLKALAKELNVGVLVLAQLNRQVETRGGKNEGRPKLSDLRESGSLEQDADVVGLLYRADYGKTDEEAAQCEGVTTLAIAKNRNGPTGDVPMTFIKSICRFESGHPVNYAPPSTSSRRGRFDD